MIVEWSRTWQAGGAWLKAHAPMLYIVHLQCLGVAAVLSVCYYLGHPPSVPSAIVLSALVFYVYVLNRYTDLQEDRVNDHSRSEFFGQRPALLAMALATVFLLILWLAATRKLHAFHLVVIGTGTLYSCRGIPWYQAHRGLVWLRLKAIPMMKNLVIGLLWGTSVFMMPILWIEPAIQNWHIVAILMTGLFVSTLTNSLFDDIKDRPGDNASKTNTIPVMLGEGASYIILLAMNLIWSVATVLLFGSGLIDGRHLVLLLVLAGYPVVYILMYAAEKTKGQVSDFLMECDLLMFAVGLSLVNLPNA